MNNNKFSTLNLIEFLTFFSIKSNQDFFCYFFLVLTFNVLKNDVRLDIILNLFTQITKLEDW